MTPLCPPNRRYVKYIIAKISDARNAIAHGRFAAIPAVNNGVIWVRADHYIRFSVQNQDESGDLMGELKRGIRVYTVSNLAKILSDMIALKRLILDFDVLISTEDLEIHEEKKNYILSSYLIEEALKQMKEAEKSKRREERGRRRRGPKIVLDD